MKRAKIKCTIWAVTTAASLFLVMSCSMAGKFGGFDFDKAKSVVKVTKALIRSGEDINNEQEYYIGRSLSAEVLSRYSQLDDAVLTTYVNKVGLAVAWASDRPETFNGYHFAVLDTDEINGLACPGGFIFITRGLLDLAEDEEGLAGILAHEIAHISYKHGLGAIRKSRFSDLGKVGLDAAGEFGGKDLKKATKIFDSCLDDMLSTLINKGYSRSQEKEADQKAVEYLASAGYNPQGLVRVLENMNALKDGKSGGLGFFKTHPEPKERVEIIGEHIKKKDLQNATPEARTKRFKEAVK